jgi:CubicO group peptidase (beta-lactamase class C family)
MMSAKVEVHGFCDSLFAEVKTAFGQNFEDRGEVGAAFSLYMEGELVVDLWAGRSDRHSLVPWQRDTQVNVFSLTKAMLITCLLSLVDDGTVDLDAPVAQYWPEFAAAGKGAISVRCLLNHRAGMPVLPIAVADQDIFNWSAMVEKIQQQQPIWSAGERQGYHVFSYGWLLGELIRRLSGLSVGEFFHRRFAMPLALNFTIGLTGDLSGIADVAAQAQAGDVRQGASIAALISQQPQSVAARAFTTPLSMLGGINSTAWRRAEIPAANGHSDAASIAKFYSSLVLGDILSPVLLDQCWGQSEAVFDEVLLQPVAFNLGFMAGQSRPVSLFSGSERSFGHPGAGGSTGFADLDYQFGCGYVTNRLGQGALSDQRAKRLIDAVYRSL